MHRILPTCCAQCKRTNPQIINDNNMRILKLIAALLLANITYSQELYIEATKQLEIGNYKVADSLFTESLCSFKNQDLFFNRGIARYKLGDTIGFCSDMNIASSNYVDKEASVYYNKFCCTNVDTIYYDKKFKKTNETNYRYYEELLYSKYNSTVIGKIHDIESNEQHVNISLDCNNKIDAAFNRTNIIAIYKIADNSKYFTKPTKSPFILSSCKYQKFKEGASAIFNAKYSFLKKRNNLESLTIDIELKISRKGDITSIRFKETFPKIFAKDAINDINNDLDEFIKHYPKITPGSFLNKKVDCIVLDRIEF